MNDHEHFLRIFGDQFEPSDRPGPLRDGIERWIAGERLDSAQAAAAFEELFNEEVPERQIAEFLFFARPEALTVDEIAAFAGVMRRRAKHVRTAFEGDGPRPGDTCGTGGDTIPTFNVSTAIMFLLAAEGLPIAKHGNRAFTSRCGSADVLQELGAEISLTPEQVRECIERTGMGFMFAPAFHGATARVRHVRQILAQDAAGGAKRKTIFNVLGPLSNPAEAPWQLLGVYSADFLEKIAEVLRRLGVERAAVVHGLPPAGLDSKGLDEVSTLGPTAMAILKDGKIETARLEPHDFGFAPASAPAVAGGDVKENAAILRGILAGEIRGPKRELILANAAAARIVGRNLEMNAATLKESAGLFSELLDSGAALKKMQAFVAATQEAAGK